MENTFPFNESEIVFEENFKPELSYGTSQAIFFADQKSKDSNPFEYYISYRLYRFDTNSGNFINHTDQLIGTRLKNDFYNKDHLTNGSVIDDLKMSRKMIALNMMFSLYNEQGCITQCDQHLFDYAIVSHLYRNYFEINSQFLSFSATKQRL